MTLARISLPPVREASAPHRATGTGGIRSCDRSSAATQASSRGRRDECREGAVRDRPGSRAVACAPANRVFPCLCRTSERFEDAVPLQQMDDLVELGLQRVARKGHRQPSFVRLLCLPAVVTGLLHGPDAIGGSRRPYAPAWGLLEDRRVTRPARTSIYNPPHGSPVRAALPSPARRGGPGAAGRRVCRKSRASSRPRVDQSRPGVARVQSSSAGRGRRFTHTVARTRQFLAIFSANLDEFFMKRVALLRGRAPCRTPREQDASG